MKSRTIAVLVFLMSVSSRAAAPSAAPAAPAAPVTSAPPAPVAPPARSAIPQVQSSLDSGIDITRLRDPFKQPEIKMSKSEPKTDPENYKVDDFKMIAVVTGPNRSKAMVQSPDGKTHLVAMNTRIGQRGGKVLKVAADRVVVREKIMNVFGQEEDLDTEIKLQAEGKR